MYPNVIVYLCETVRVMCKIGNSVLNMTRDLARRHRRLPGPKGLPVLGNMLQMDMQRIQHQLTSWGETYGKLFQINLLGKKVVVISDVQLLDKALSGYALCPHLNDRSENITKHVYYGRKHIGLADLTPETVALRNILKQNVLSAFSAQHTFDANCGCVINSFIHSLVNGSTSGNVDPDRLIKDFLTDLNSLILIGETLPEDDPDRDVLWELIDHLYTLLDPSIDAPLRLFPFLRFLPIKHGRIFKETIRVRDRVAKRFMDTQKSTYQEGRVRGLVDVCLKIQREECTANSDSWLTDDYIRGLMYDTVVAGMSEMMKSIRMLILLMCHYQDAQSRVQSEIDDVIGNSALPSCNHKQQMPYTQAVILEMMRYVSQTPLAIPHKCNKDVFLDGYLIEKNAGIFPNIWGIHHDEEVWGDPWAFRPERFLNEEGTLLPKDHKLMKSLIPFSVGKRRCPGEDFAMSRLFLVLTSLLQKVDFLPPDDQELPSVDPRQYNNRYPLHLPVFSCKVAKRGQ